MCWRSPTRATEAAPLEPLAAFMTNPAGSAIVNAIGPIRQIVQNSATAERRYLVIAPGEPAKFGDAVQVQSSMNDMLRLIEPADTERCRRYARALVRNRATADDLVQDCLERAISHWGQRREGDPRPWLFSDPAQPRAQPVPPLDAPGQAHRHRRSQ